MVDPRVIHSITIEMCTGFLLLAGTAIVVKVVADTWLRRLHGRSRRLDELALKASGFAEPAAYFALAAGVLATFVSMVTGSLAWPPDQLWASETVHNKILTTAVSQALFIGAVVLRSRFGFRLWMTKLTAASYALMILSGDALMTLQNSIAGHLAGKGSLLDDLLQNLRIQPQALWVFPDWASVAMLIAFPLATAAVGLWLRASKQRAPSLPATA